MDTKNGRGMLWGGIILTHHVGTTKVSAVLLGPGVSRRASDRAALLPTNHTTAINKINE